MAWTMKQNDTAPPYVAQLRDRTNGTPVNINLTTATSVTFIMRATDVADVAPKVHAAATIVDATNGIVSYSWATGDTDTIDDFNIEFEILWASGKKQTVPNNAYNILTVKDDLDAG